MAAGTMLAVDEIRPAAAAALAPAGDDDPYVFSDLVDSLEPPALLLDWDDPWLTAGPAGLATMGPCLYTARLRVVMIAGRLEPGPGYQTLDRLATYVLGRLREDPAHTWPLDQVGAGGQYDLAGVTYLAAAAVYMVPTTL